MLPQTYLEFSKKYRNSPFINILCSSPIRVYYKHKKFHCFVTSIEGIIPLECKTALCLARSINDIIKEDEFVDLSYHFPLDISQNWCLRYHDLN